MLPSNPRWVGGSNRLKDVLVSRHRSFFLSVPFLCGKSSYFLAFAVTKRLSSILRLRNFLPSCRAHVAVYAPCSLLLLLLSCAARTIKYDKLVLAVGAEPASGIDKVPGARGRAIPFYSIEDSYRVKQAIIKLKVKRSILDYRNEFCSKCACLSADPTVAQQQKKHVFATCAIPYVGTRR